MSGDVMVGTVRERRFADTLAEIKRTALRQLAASGVTKLSLRAVAREVGMTVQSLYHYVASYDGLITLLVVDGHQELADEIHRAAARTVGQSRAERLLATTSAYREWALSHRPQFLLIYGTPVPGYTAPEATLPAVWKQASAFRDVVFDGWTPQELGRIPQDPLTPQEHADIATPAAHLPPAGQAVVALPPAALRYLIELRATMHGLVMLELLGHLGPVPGGGAALMRNFSLRTARLLAEYQRTGLQA